MAVGIKNTLRAAGGLIPTAFVLIPPGQRARQPRALDLIPEIRQQGKQFGAVDDVAAVIFPGQDM